VPGQPAKPGGAARDAAHDASPHDASLHDADLDRYTGYISSRLRKLITALEFEAAVSRKRETRMCNKSRCNSIREAFY
jgi:hypothetical protein